MNYILSDHGVTVIHENRPYTVSSGNSHFEELKQAIIDNRWDLVPDLLDRAMAIKRYMLGNVEIRGDEIFYRGEVVHSTLTERILQFHSEKLPVEPLLKFFENLMLNPSRRAIQELYTFLEHKNLAITENGEFLAYKGVNGNYTDVHTGRFPNQVGRVLKMQRRDVCDDADIGCSHGYHVGNWDYANGFAPSEGHVMLVKVNPKDVVSVPKDCSCQKLRTCCYEVVGEADRQRGAVSDTLVTNQTVADKDYYGDAEPEDDDIYGDGDTND